MFIEEIGRHLAVSSIPELQKSLKLDKGFWSVISIREPQVPKPEFLGFAKRYHIVICEDRELLFTKAPEAYKDIGTVIRDLVDAGLVSVIATLRPILTYKTRKETSW